MKQIWAVVILLAGASLAQADGGQAYSAVRTAQRVASTGALVQVMGQRGEPNPQQWTLLYSDPKARGGVLEVVVSGNEVVSQRTPLRGYTGLTAEPALKISRLKYDSDAAFGSAERQAAKQGLGFNWVDYTLRADVVTGMPFWVLRLFDHMGAPVGVTEISAEDGSIITPLKANRPRNNEDTANFNDSPSGKKIGGVIGVVTGAVEKAAVTAKDATLRTVGTVQEVMTGERTIGPKDEEE